MFSLTEPVKTQSKMKAHEQLKSRIKTRPLALIQIQSMAQTRAMYLELKKEALKKEALKKEALKKEALKKEALKKEALKNKHNILQVQNEYKHNILQVQNEYKHFNHNETFKRIIIPIVNYGDLPNNLNSNVNCNKTIVSVLDYGSGFADYLKGSILLAQYAKHFNINFNMNLYGHNITKYLINWDNGDELLSSNQLNKQIHRIYCKNSNYESKMYLLIKQFLNSNEPILYITTNLFYNRNLVTEDIKQYINSVVKFKQSYYDQAHKLFNLTNYNVLHIRCTDDNFNTDFKEDTYLLTEILKLQLSPNTIILSNNYSLKKKLNQLFGFYFIDSKSFHTAHTQNDYTELESTVIDYIVMSNSSRTFCFSYYFHGSGFSEQCSVLNAIPYSVVYLPRINMNTNNINLLINHKTDLLENNFITPFLI
jgi:hypothetical protein